MKMLKIPGCGTAGRAILFFNGWGMDEHVTAHFAAPDSDIFLFHDYREIKCLPPEEFAAYEVMDLVAWSLGVAAAAHALGILAERLRYSVAVNGTLYPVHARYAIAPEVFQGTIDHWHEEPARSKFMLRMGSKRDVTPDRAWEEQREELLCLRDLPAGNNIYQKALIGLRDRIIPAATQRAFWLEQATESVELPDAPHDLFGRFTSFDEVIGCEQ